MHFMDSIFIFGLMLVLFGPKKLPEIARQAGKLMMEFRRASNDFKLQMEEELRAAEQADRQKKIDAENEAQRAIAASTTTASLPDGSIAQLAPEETAGTAAQEVVPTILPPSVGEMVPAAPNRYRVEREAETLNPGTPQAETPQPETFDHVIPVPPVQSDQLSADEFYGENRTAPANGRSPIEAEAFPAASLNGAAASQPEAPGPADTGKSADTAPLAESDQAPIHHG
jgi:sec-independent protein translocase protein TatB